MGCILSKQRASRPTKNEDKYFNPTLQPEVSQKNLSGKNKSDASGRTDDMTSHVPSTTSSTPRPTGPIRSNSTEGLELGRLTEIWKNPEEWNRYKTFLTTVRHEGLDGSGKRLGCERYATFLEMYVQLHVDEEKVDKTGKNVTTDEELKTRVWQIWSHEEGFFKEQRRLKVIEGPMLKSIRESVKSVKDGKCRGGKWVYQPAYSKVFDQLNIWLGSYHEKETLKLQATTSTMAATSTTVTTTQSKISSRTMIVKKS